MLNKNNKLFYRFSYFMIFLVTVFFIIKTFYPVLLYSIYFLAYPDFPILNGIFKELSNNLEIIIHVYTISLGMIFILRYLEKK
jgi:hypothetical protein